MNQQNAIDSNLFRRRSLIAIDAASGGWVNSHFISRCLTKPWELEGRVLKYYDFEKDRILEQSSRSLFAIDDLYSKNLEKFLGDIETILGNFRKDLIDGKDVFNVENWRQFRSLYMLVLLQAQRFSSSRSVQPRDGLEELVTKGESFADGLVSTMLEENQLVAIRTTENERLFFPETGMFSFATRDSACVTTFTWAFGVPIHPQIFIALISKTASPEYVRKLQNTKHLFMGRSVGTSKSCNKIIIPREVLEVNDEGELIAAIKHWRRLADEGVELINKLRANVQAMYDLAGLTISTERASVGGRMKLE